MTEKRTEIPYHLHTKVPLSVRQRDLDKVLTARMAVYAAALATLEASRALDKAGVDAESVFQSARYAVVDYTVGEAYEREVAQSYEDALGDGGMAWANELKREIDNPPGAIPRMVPGPVVPTHDADGNDLPF